MKTRTLSRQHHASYDLGYPNLVVAGCSYTDNNHSEYVVAWPYMLRDLCSFDRVVDCSLGGAGNLHIVRSVVTALELDPTLTPADTLVVVMLSGYDRDDYIVTPDAIRPGYTDFVYEYTPGCCAGITCETQQHSNMLVDAMSIKRGQSRRTQALQQYINIVTFKRYLEARGFRHVITEFSQAGTRRDNNFDIAEYLEPPMADRFNAIARQLQPSLGDMAPESECADGYHPAPEHHLAWCQQVLIPAVLALVDP